jgi:hypothetical protein
MLNGGVAKARSSADSAAVSRSTSGAVGSGSSSLAVAAKPGPVPRAARPLILSLFAVLVLANSYV